MMWYLLNMSDKSKYAAQRLILEAEIFQEKLNREKAFARQKELETMLRNMKNEWMKAHDKCSRAESKLISLNSFEERGFAFGEISKKVI